jgi:hypothetical protein
VAKEEEIGVVLEAYQEIMVMDKVHLLRHLTYHLQLHLIENTQHGISSLHKMNTVKEDTPRELVDKK